MGKCLEIWIEKGHRQTMTPQEKQQMAYILKAGMSLQTAEQALEVFNSVASSLTFQGQNQEVVGHAACLPQHWQCQGNCRQSAPGPGIWWDELRDRKSWQREAWLSDQPLQSMDGDQPNSTTAAVKLSHLPHSSTC